MPNPPRRELVAITRIAAKLKAAQAELESAMNVAIWKGATQTAIAEAAGVSGATVSRMLRGRVPEGMRKVRPGVYVTPDGYGVRRTGQKEWQLVSPEGDVTGPYTSRYKALEGRPQRGVVEVPLKAKR